MPGCCGIEWAKDNGERLLPTKNYLEYTGKMQEFANRFDTQVKAFPGIYPELINQACETLSQMFNPADFRPVFDLVAKEENPPCCLVYLTDLCCEKYPQQIPRYYVLWVNTERFRWKEPPFGSLHFCRNCCGVWPVQRRTHTVTVQCTENV